MTRTLVWGAVFVALVAPGAARSEGTWEVTPAGEEAAALGLEWLAKNQGEEGNWGCKDLGLVAMAYGGAYVAQVAFGARDNQTVRAFVEADRHPGPSIIIAYSHCIAHGFDLKAGCDHQKMAVEAGLWPLYRSDPARAAKGEPPLKLDAGGEMKRKVSEFTNSETRFRMVQKLDPKRFERLQIEAQGRGAAAHPGLRFP